MKTEVLSAERLRAVLIYEGETGLFTRKTTVGSHKAGTIAGTPDKDGYIRIMVDGRRYGAHRLAWLYVHGAFPEFEVDHENGFTSDNRFDNLRSATSAQNSQNQNHARSDSQTQIKGVCMSRGKFKAQIQHQGRVYHLGRFERAEEAQRAYAAAAKRLHTHNPHASK